MYLVVKYVLSDIGLKYIEKKLPKLKGEIDKYMITVGDFYILLLLDRNSSKKKFSKHGKEDN